MDQKKFPCEGRREGEGSLRGKSRAEFAIKPERSNKERNHLSKEERRGKLENFTISGLIKKGGNREKLLYIEEISCLAKRKELQDSMYK